MCVCTEGAANQWLDLLRPLLCRGARAYVVHHNRLNKPRVILGKRMQEAIRLPREPFLGHLPYFGTIFVPRQSRMSSNVRIYFLLTKVVSIQVDTETLCCYNNKTTGVELLKLIDVIDSHCMAPCYNSMPPPPPPPLMYF